MFVGDYYHCAEDDLTYEVIELAVDWFTHEDVIILKSNYVKAITKSKFREQVLMKNGWVPRFVLSSRVLVEAPIPLLLTLEPPEDE